jgi:1-deoxy-D-xylulose-5-phosphate reductoisomerase
MTNRITILGSTGSIGVSTLDVIEQLGEDYAVDALTGHGNIALLAQQARDARARLAVTADESLYLDLKEALAGSGIAVAAGKSGLAEAAEGYSSWVMAAIVGTAGLAPTLAAARRGANIALANKECLVSAGDLFIRAVANGGGRLLPVDSEHNAIFQVLEEGQRHALERIILTASGGPFRTWTREQIESATIEQALKHPNWSMGRKITIDSATMFNKGLEIIEAYHLFDLEPDQIDVLVHPQSIIHGLVEFSDRSVIAQMGAPDMRTPIAHCLAWPERIDGPAKRLDLAEIGQLTFEAPDPVRFPSLRLVQQALRAGGAIPTVFNAANEVAVDAFLNGRIGFGGIARLVEATMEAAARTNSLPKTADDALSIDHSSRNMARDLLPEIAAKAS